LNIGLTNKYLKNVERLSALVTEGNGKKMLH
jgi:hypothetical protein